MYLIIMQIENNEHRDEEKLLLFTIFTNNFLYELKKLMYLWLLKKLNGLICVMYDKIVSYLRSH